MVEECILNKRGKQNHVKYLEKLLFNHIKETEKLIKEHKIMFTPADKGNWTVVIMKEDYCDKVRIMLSYQKVYDKVDKDPTPQLIKDFTTLITKWKKKKVYRWKII